jgi:predicted transcriptional regulator
MSKEEDAKINVKELVEVNNKDETKKMFDKITLLLVNSSPEELQRIMPAVNMCMAQMSKIHRKLIADGMIKALNRLSSKS